MPNIARTKTWNANETLTAADLNAEFDGILTGVNDNALNNDNLNQTDDYLFGSMILGTGLSAAGGDGKLHVHVASAGSVTAHANGNDFVIEGTANPGMSFLSGASTTNSIYFGDVNDNDIGSIVYDHSTNDLTVTANALTVLRYDSSDAAIDIVGAAGSPGSLNLQTEELTVVDGDILGRIDFQAPLESDGTDAILVAASIWAEADDTFAADNNDTDLVFAVAESETAAERMRLGYDGTNTELTFGSALALSAGTNAINVTAGDMTLFDDNNNADTSLSIGTSATEALKIEVLNGAANKTAEEVRFTTSTASGTAEHGKFSFYVDDVEIGDIDDGGIDLAAGMAFSVDGSAVGGAALTGSTNNTITTVTGADAFQGEANLTFDGTTLDVVGNAGVGIARTDGTFHVNTASAGAITFDSNLDDLIIENSGHGGLTVAVPDASLGYLGWQSPSSTAGHNQFTWSYNSGVEQIVAYCAGGGIMSWNAGGLVGINETLNADMTTGLTINQGANDDALLIFKSSDVNNESIGSWETDSFASFGKLDSTNGGLVIRTMANDALSQGFEVQSYAGQPSTTPATSATCSAEIWGYQHSNGAVGNMVANGLCFGVGTYTGSTGKLLFCVDEDGDYHYDGVDGGAYDSYVDAELVRATSHVLTSPKDLVRSKWDEMVRYQKQDLIDAGLLGACSPEDEAKGHRGLVNGPAMQRLHTGAIWQNHTDMMEIARVLSPEQKAALPEHIQQKLLEN